MDYIVNSDTLVVMPVSNNRSEVIENFQNIILDYNSFRVIQESCLYYGISYKNRIGSTYKFINVRYKPPVMIEESMKVIFFPINSPRNVDSYWVSYNNILYYIPGSKKNETIVSFKNGYNLVVPVSFYSFNSQYAKAARLFASYSRRVFNLS